MLISNYTELEQWLSDQNYFEDGFILSASEHPFSIRIGCDIEGNYWAGTKRVIKCFNVTPIDAATLPIQQFREETFIAGIDAVEDNSLLGMFFDFDNSFKILARKFQVDEPEEIITTYTPHVSDRELFASFKLDNIPPADYWIHSLRKLGHDVVARYFGSDELASDNVPYPDYSGYFLQLASRLKTNPQGVMLSINKTNDAVCLTVTNYDDELNTLWRNLSVIISQLPEAFIHCGNCLFDSKQWKRFIDTGEITEYTLGPAKQ